LASYESDEEQIEALKRWWEENGNSLIIGVVIVLAVLFGSRAWQGSQQAKAEEASDLYDSIVQAVALNQGADLDEAGLAGLESAYDSLRNDHGDSIYTRYGALMLASVYVRQENYDQAAAELSWVLDNQELGFMRSAEPELFLAARLRLARVKLTLGEAREALDLLLNTEPGALAAGYAEVQGDAYRDLGEQEQARGAYERALALQPDNARFIELKLLGLDG